MNSGYIYILINDSFKDMIKIGCTGLSPTKRAKQLSSSTGVPTPYKVAYEIYVDNYTEFEKQLHDELADFRVASNREFFRYPIYKAIELIQELNKKNRYNSNDKFEAIEILPYIKYKYGSNIKPDITSIRLLQDDERVYFEFTINEYIAEYLKNQYITRVDLGFIADPDDNYNIIPVFDSEFSIKHNVDSFLELDDISLINCVGDIFTKEWIDSVFK